MQNINNIKISGGTKKKQDLRLQISERTRICDKSLQNNEFTKTNQDDMATANLNLMIFSQ